MAERVPGSLALLHRLGPGLEFGIEIAARAGGLLSVLAEVGATAQVRVKASWDRHDDAALPLRHEEPDPE